jgi:type VI secretion system Hcp family effector
MAQTFKVTFTGQDTKGSSGRWRDSVEGTEYQHSITHQYNAATGGSAGERSWSPVCITFYAYDPSIIGLLKHTSSREKPLLDKVVVEWFRTSQDGKIVCYLKNTMENVLVHKVELFTPEDKSSNGADDHMKVRVQLIFARIQYETLGGKAMDDAWDARG